MKRLGMQAFSGHVWPLRCFGGAWIRLDIRGVLCATLGPLPPRAKRFRAAFLFQVWRSDEQSLSAERLELDLAGVHLHLDVDVLELVLRSLMPPALQCTASRQLRNLSHEIMHVQYQCQTVDLRAHEVFELSDPIDIPGEQPRA